MFITRHICAVSLLQLLVCWTRTAMVHGQVLGTQLDSDENFKQEIGLKMIPNMKEIEIESQSIFEITCISSTSITWSFQPSLVDEVYDKDIPRTSIKAFANETHQQSILTIRNASAFNVGLYVCGDDSWQLATAKIYVFVKDFNYELVPVGNQTIRESTDEFVRIPCKPSFQNVRVELYRKRLKTLTWVPVESYEQNDKIGFILYKSREQIEEYMCRSMGKSNSVLHFNVTGEGMSWKKQTKDSGRESIRSITIQNNDGAHIALGNIIRLNCSISFTKTITIQHMRWILPNNQPAKDNLRTHVTVLNDSVPVGEELITRILMLTIANATPQESGKFNCEVKAKDQDNTITRNRRTAVTIVHGNESFIDLAVIEVLTSSNVRLDSQVRIVVDYSAYPMPKFYWTKDDSEGPLNGTRYSVSMDHESVTLTINNVSLDDAGNYTLRVENRKETITRQVYISGKPVLNLIVYPHKSVCRSKAYPAARMESRFLPCSDDTLSNCSNNDTSEAKPQRSYKNGLFVSSLTLHLGTSTSTPGYGVCEATNSEGTSFIQVPLVVSTFKDKLTLLRIPSETDIIAGDRVLILCASKETSNITFTRNGSKMFMNITDVVYSTQKVYLKQLTLDDITENDQGTIECQANDESTTGFHRRNLTLTVHKPTKPKLLTLIKKSKQLSKGSQYEMKCKVEGHPKPSIEWFKVGEPLILSNSSAIQLHDDDAVLSFKDLNFNDTGYYMCRAKNKYGSVENSWFLDVRRYRVVNVWKYSGLLVLILLVVICVVLCALNYKKRKEIRTLKKIGLSLPRSENEYTLNPQIFLNDQTDVLSYNDEYEFLKEKLTLGEPLGMGQFGVVVKATAKGIMAHEDETTVAVKSIKTHGNIEEMRSLVSELKIMIHIGQHLNVVNLLGAVTKNVSKNPLMVIVEYCPYGNVESHLKRHRNDFINQVESSSSSNSRQSHTSIHMAKDGNKDLPNPTTLVVTDLVCWASQVACGMDYLVSKNVLHGDLAARNILLCDGNVVKICDFGLAQSMRADQKCKKQSDQMLPVKWLALECLETNTFGTPSDVWAYGVMLWEFFSLAQVPYLEFKTPDDLFSKLRDGYRLECPTYANQEIYELMLSCWRVNPDSRPSFKDLSVRFSSMLPTELQDNYMKLNEPYMDMNAKRTNKLELDDSNYDGVPQEEPPSRPSEVISTNNDNAEGSTAQKSSTAFNRFYANYFPFLKSEASPTLKRNLNSYLRRQTILSRK